MKTTFKSIGLLSMLLIVVCSTCELVMDYSYEIHLVNNAEHSIGYYFADGGKYGTFYPDSLPETNEYVMYDISRVLSPGYAHHYSNWEKYFRTLPNDTLSLFIFHTDTLNKYKWEEIRKNYRVLKRYDLSIEDIQLLDYEIPYPPTEKMKNMRMYPPYDE